MEHEDDELDGPERDDARDPQDPRREQLRLRAARPLPVAVRARRPEHRQPRPVGDGGVQAAAALAQRGEVQEDLRHVDRLQEHRVEDRQRVEAVMRVWRAEEALVPPS